MCVGAIYASRSTPIGSPQVELPIGMASSLDKMKGNRYVLQKQTKGK
jgi:hypothetical protein